jgi:hypothetical protein
MREELKRGLLKPLPMREGGERRAELYLVFAHPTIRTSRRNGAR